MVETKKRRRKVSIIIIVVLIIYCFIQNNWIEIEHITLDLDGIKGEPIRIVHITDTQIPKNASKINKILELVRDQKPDVIFMTGDIVDRTGSLKSLDFSNLCSGLSSIAKTYAVAGNHEMSQGNMAMEDYYSVLKENNIESMDNKATKITVNGQKIQLIGLKSYSNYTKKLYSKYQIDSGIPKVLLSHHPELYKQYLYTDESLKPDVILSGHAHGGQFRIPFIDRGLYSPGQGYFPSLTSGLYKMKGSYMVLSRGLGNSTFPIRVHNRPHIPVIELR